MFTREDLIGVAIISAIFTLILITAELWKRVGNAKPEWTRKLVHLGGGLLGLFLPFLIRSPLVVFLLTASLSALFLIGGKTRLLKSVHGVERSSRGSEYYPLAIFIVFLLAADRPWLYLSSVLVLAVADAFAALIGSRYGVVRYQVEDEYKSVEGSLVFLVIAFLAVEIPTLLLTELPDAVVIMSALLVALLVTGFEAISLRGTDNIFVPIAVAFVLQKITTKPLGEIVYQNLSLIGIFIVVGLIAWRFRAFNVGGSIAVVLFIFATWSLGSRRWSIPVFLALLAFVLVRAHFARREVEPLRVRVITHALLVPFIVLLFANLTGRYGFFYAPYVAAATVVFALILWDGRQRVGALARWNPYAAAAMSGFVSAGAIALPTWLIFRATAPWPTLIALCALAAIATMINAFAVRFRFDDAAPPRGWSGVSFLIALGAAGVVVLLQNLHVVSAFRA